MRQTEPRFRQTTSANANKQLTQHKIRMLKQKTGEPYRFHACPKREGCICSAEKQENELSEAWSFADKIFCICLSDRNDRLVEASEQFHKYGLCKKVLFYRPSKPTDDEMAELKPLGIRCKGLYGVWRSHHELSMFSKKLKLKNVIVFEDDVRFLPQQVTAENVKQIGVDLKRLPSKWELMYLGHVPFWGYPVTTDLRLFRVGSQMAHAYILSEHGIKKLNDRDYLTDFQLNQHKERGIDQYFCMTLRQYAIRPQMVVQSGSRSSNLQNGKHTLSTWYQDEFIPWGIELHRDHIPTFEFITFLIFPVILISGALWFAKRRHRMICLFVLLILLKLVLL